MDIITLFEGSCQTLDFLNYYHKPLEVTINFTPLEVINDINIALGFTNVTFCLSSHYNVNYSSHIYH